MSTAATSSRRFRPDLGWVVLIVAVPMSVALAALLLSGIQGLVGSSLLLLLHTSPFLVSWRRGRVQMDACEVCFVPANRLRYVRVPWADVLKSRRKPDGETLHLWLRGPRRPVALDLTWMNEETRIDLSRALDAHLKRSSCAA